MNSFTICDVLRKEIEECRSAIIAPDPLMSISKSHYGDIRVKLVSRITHNGTSPFMATILFHVRAVVDHHTKSVGLRWSSTTDIARAFMHDADRHILSFLSSYQNTKNNKLTSLYRWYNQNLREAQLKLDMQHDMFSIGKFIAEKGLGDQLLKAAPNTSVVPGVLQALELLKQKYITKGVGSE